MKMKILSSQAALAALLAVSFAQGETEREVELTDAHLASINGKLVELTAGLETANASLAEKNKLIVNQATKISTLEANAAAPNAPAAVTATTEGAKSEDKADNFTSETDALLASIKANMGSPIPTA